ncbi:uncharacterized protein BCR38DRAFT_485384 [Pseudomassariella vexata]|uniref:Adhesin domain-containing protein n=1 Tax=Pseudomassariella vexata TaxID=1141098 RepID=A0A1Y2DYR4_9PEZI|nr:uncharacterized protein BCR38DRAFT_485384 [Pseudomassariella vexata]ORY64246.1 hypothetical protein BCR38DRAFT_485384 [Pseudomassariella vexata]
MADDGPYSAANDSDGDEDVSVNQLSPSDGFFAPSSSSNVVPHVPNVMLIDPTLQRPLETAAESKAREADEAPLAHSRRSYHHTPGASYYSEQRQASSFAQPARHNTTSYPSYPLYIPSSSSAAASTSTVPSGSQQQVRAGPFIGRAPSLYSDAPPPYSPSPTSPLSPASPSNQARNYSTITYNMGIENERLLGQDPESMAEPGEGDEPQRSPLWARRIRKRLLPWMSWRMLMLTVILLAVTVGFLASSYRVFKGGENKNSIRPQVPSDGVERPPEEPQQPPTAPGAPSSQPLQPTFCTDASLRFPDQILAVDFGKNQNLTFVQDSHNHGGNSQVRVGGQVNLRLLDGGGEPRIILEIVTNDENLRLDVFADKDLQAMRVSVPKKFASLDSGDVPCVEMRATIWVPKGGQLKELKIGAIQLDILLLDDLSIQVDGYSRITSITGDIVSGADKPLSYENLGLVFNENPDYTFVPAKQSYNLDSRVTEVTSTSGKINGNWPLYDVLGLHTTAGDVKVSITPKSVLESDPKPAILSISSISGYIHATEPVHLVDQILLREYLVDLKSTSGGIHGAFAFGSGVELKSTASDIAVDLLPVIDSDKLSASRPAQLETTTTSGTTAIRILEPVWFGSKKATREQKYIPYQPIGNGDSHDSIQPVSPPDSIAGSRRAAAVARPFDCLQALHKSTSSDVGLRYPQSWVGDLQAQSTSGTLNVKGKDVRVTKSTGGWPGTMMKAHKGKSGNGSTIVVNTMMGSLDAVIGDT